MQNTLSKTMLAVVAVVVAGAVVTGCGSGDEQSGTEGTASQSAPAVLSERVPADFPLVEGDLVRADETGAAAWSATVSVDDAEAQQKALDDLLAAGFTEHGSDESDPSLRTFSLNDETDAVTLVLTQSGDQHLVTYSYAPMVG